MPATRLIEMFVGVYEGDARTWYEAGVEIPADTPDDQIDVVATRMLARDLESSDDLVAFYGVMHVWDLAECEAMCDDDQQI